MNLGVPCLDFGYWDLALFSEAALKGAGVCRDLADGETEVGKGDLTCLSPPSRRGSTSHPAVDSGPHSPGSTASGLWPPRSLRGAGDSATGPLSVHGPCKAGPVAGLCLHPSPAPSTAVRVGSDFPVAARPRPWGVSQHSLPAAVTSAMDRNHTPG